MNAPLTEKAPERALSIKRIVVAIALPPNSEATARYAVEIAKAFGASIVLVQVHAPPEVNENITQAGYQEMDWQQQGAQEALANLTKTLQGDYPACEECFFIGKPAEQVAWLARELNPDLIITASQHPSFLGRLFHLDRAPQIVHRAPCPVSVYHEKGGC